MQRQRKSNAAPAVDAISSLPNVILSLILSLLPIKEAVATSILSKRWIHVWHFVDTIDFPDIITVNSIQSAYIFNKFMDSVLVSRYFAGSFFINSFRLKIEYSDSNLGCNLGLPNVTKLVDLVVQCGLEYLCLHLLQDDDDDDSDDDYVDDSDSDDDYDDVIGHKLTLPISILSCKTLVSLDLRHFSVKGFKFSSVGFGFPSLKVFHLNDIVFQTVRDFMLLLAGCQNLECLRAEYIYFYSKQYFCEGDSPIIQVFERLNLPKLISATIIQCWLSCFPMKGLSKSEHLCVETYMLCTKDENVHETYQLQCPYYDIPIFHNLTRLELHDRLELVLRKLQYFPKLQNLELHQGSFEIRREQEVLQNWVEPEVVPQCISSNLRTCTIHKFSGLQSELMFIKYILKSARNIQIMKIHYISYPPEIEIELSTFPKASATCKLYLIHII